MSRDPWLRLLAQQEAHSQVKRGPQAGYTSIAEGEGSLDVEVDGTVAASFGNQMDGTFGAAAFNGPEPPVPSPPATDGGPGTVAISWDGGYVAGARRPLDQDFIDVLVAPDPGMDGAIRAGTFVTGGSITYTTWEPGTYYFALVTETKPGRRSAMSEVVEGTAEVTVTEAKLAAAREALEAADQQLRDAAAARDQKLNTAIDDLDAAEQRLADAETNLNTAFGDIEAVEDRTISRGTDLVTNGTGLLGNNYNFTGLTYDPTDAPAGASGSFVKASDSRNSTTSDEPIPVSTNKSYKVAVTARERNPAATDNSRIYVGLQPEDGQGRRIDPRMYAHDPATETTLAADLKPGDTTATVTAISGTWMPAGSGSWMGLWDWQDESGKVWPVGTYTRNYTARIASVSGTTITFEQPWSGALIPSGNPVTRNVSGGGYMYAAAADYLTSEWTTYSRVIVGPGVHDGATMTAATDKFPAGTAQTRIIFLINYTDEPGSEQAFALLSMSDASAAQHTATEAVTRVEQAEIDLRTAEGRLEANETALTTAEGRLDTAETSLDTLNNTTLPGLQGELTELADTTIPALDARLDTAETTIGTTLPDAISDAQDAADMALLIAPVSANAPTTADGAGRPVDSVWTRVNAAGQEIGRWRWTGSTWTTMPLTATVIPNLAASKITTGTLATARLNATEVAAAVATVIQLNADRITSGIIDTARLNATEIAAAVATVIELNADRITAGIIGAARLDTDAIAAATAAIQQVDAGNITVTGTSNLNDVVAERIASKTGQFIELSVGQLTVPGSAAISDLVAEHFAARTSALIEADIGKLTVTAGATINQAVIEKLFSDVVVGETVTATEAFVGNNAILTGAITARTITASEEMTAKMVRATMFEGKSFTGGTFTGSLFQTSAAANSGIKIDLATNTLSMWDPTGRLMIEADADTGNLAIEGTQSSTAAAEDGTGQPIELTLSSGAGVSVDNPVTGATYTVPGIVWSTSNTARMTAPPKVFSEAGEGITVDSGVNAANQYASLKMTEGQASLSVRNAITLTAQAGPITLTGTGALIAAPADFRSTAHVEGNSNEAMTFGTDAQNRTIFRNPDAATYGFANTGGGWSNVETGTVTANGRLIATTSIETSQGEIFSGGGNMNVQGNGVSFNIGRDGSGARITSDAAYNRTYSSSPNMYVTGAGTIGRSTSARKYKLAIDPMEDIEDRLLSIPLSTWYDKTESEAVSEWYTAENEGRPHFDDDGNPIQDAPPTLRRIPGIVAEDVEAAGLGEFVTYGADGQVEALMYERLAAALIPTVRRLRDRADTLEARITDLEATLAPAGGITGTNTGGTRPR